MISVTLYPNALSGRALAEICAALTREAEHEYNLGLSSNHIHHAEAARILADALAANVGDEEAVQMLADAGALPEWLMVPA